MPLTLKDDAFDYDEMLAPVRALVDPTDPIYRCMPRDTLRNGSRTTLEVRRKGGKTSRLPVPADLVTVVDEWRALLALGVETGAGDPIVCVLKKQGPHGLAIPTPLQPVTSSRMYSMTSDWLDVIGITGVDDHEARLLAERRIGEHHVEPIARIGHRGYRPPHAEARLIGVGRVR